MKNILFLVKYRSLPAKLLALLLGVIFINACPDSSSQMNSANRPTNATQTNGNGNVNSSETNANSIQTTGDETMTRDLQIPGQFNCKKDEEITLDFQPVNTTSIINFDFKNENNRGVVSLNKLTFKCSKNRKLRLLFTFSGNNGSYKIIFSTNSGTVINDELPIRQPLSEMVERVVYDFKISNIGG